MKEILEPRKRPEVVRVEVPPTRVSDAVTAEEYAADVAVDDAEVDGVEDPPVSFDAPEGVPEYVADEVRGLAEAAMAEAEGRLNETPEAGAEETPDHDPDGCDECLAAETAEQEAHAEPEPPPEPRSYVLDIRAGPFREFLNVLNALADEARVVVARDSIKAKVVDPAHIALVEVSLGDVAVAAANATDGTFLEDGTFEVGLDVEKLSALFKKAKKDEMIRIKADLPDSGGRDRLTFNVNGMTRTVGAIDTSGMSDPKIPKMDALHGTFEVQGKTLYEALRPCEDVSDHTVLTLTKDGLNVYAEGDIDKVSLDLDASVAERVSVLNGEPVKSMFPLDYLQKFLKTVKDERLTVRLGNDHPICITWDGVTKGEYLCAPRIESDSY